MAGHESKPGTGETGGGGSPYNWDVLTDGQNAETYTIPEDQHQEIYTAEEGNWGNDDGSVHFETVETEVPPVENPDSTVEGSGDNAEEDDTSAETENNQETFEKHVEGVVDNIGSYRPADVLRAAKKAGISLPSYRPSKLKEYALDDPTGGRLVELMKIAANFSDEETEAMKERKKKKGETGGKPKEEETAKPAEEAPVPPVETEAAKPGEEEAAKPTAEEETAKPAEEAPAEEAPAEEAPSEETPEETDGDNSEEEGDNSEETDDSSEESGDNSEEGDGDSEETTEEEATAPIPPVPVPPVPVEGASEETGDDSKEDDDDSEEGDDNSEESHDNSEETGGDDSEEDDSDDSGEGDDSGEDNDDDSEEDDLTAFKDFFDNI